MTRGAVGDKKRKCSVDHNVSLNRSFSLVVVADESIAFVGLHGLQRMRPLNWDTARVCHVAPPLCLQ